MNRYLTWVDGRRDETEEELEAVTSWEARKIKAKQFNVKPATVVGQRIWAK